MALNAQDVGLAEGISSGMRECIVDQRATKEREWEIECRGGDGVAWERYCRWWRKFLRGSQPGIERAAGDGLVMMSFVACGAGRSFVATAAVHIGHGVRLMP